MAKTPTPKPAETPKAPETTSTDEVAKVGTAAPETAAPAAVETERPHDLRITSRRDGFRRGGLAHPSEPTPHYGSAFGESQLRQILAEPVLVVEVRNPETGDWRLIDDAERKELIGRIGG